MNRDELFVEVMADLNNTMFSAIHDRGLPGAKKTEFIRHIEYKTMRMAQILRLLLIDGQCLLAQVNKERRLKIEFRVRDGARLVKSPSTTLSIGGESLAPFQRDEPTTAYGRGAFLKFEVLAFGMRVVAVLEPVKHVAHVSGAVNALDPTDDLDRALESFDANVVMRGFPIRIACD